MKAKTFFFLIISIALLNSCKKNRICECTSDFYASPQQFDYGKMRYQQAYEQCKAANKYFEKSTLPQTWTCQLK
jgi:hypothetical protein